MKDRIEFRFKTAFSETLMIKKVIGTLTQVDFHGAFQKLLEWYN